MRTRHNVPALAALLIVGACSSGTKGATVASTTNVAPVSTVAPTTNVAPVSTVAPTTADATPPATQISTTTPPAVAPTTIAPTFGDGTMLVGADIPSGRYIAVDARGCSWSRLNDPNPLGGSNNQIALVLVEEGPAIVDISPSDVAFHSDNCGGWVAFSGGAPVTEFGVGDWAVGSQIAPGRWQSSGGSYCGWTRLKGFGGTPDEIIEQSPGLVIGPATVDIAPSDGGFYTDQCGVWTKVG